MSETKRDDELVPYVAVSCLTLRDWFAGQALAGSLVQNQAFNNPSRCAAEWAYQFADAMLEARKR